MKRILKFYLYWLILFSYAVTAYLSYEAGVDDGYWEHEGEENAYGCEVI